MILPDNGGGHWGDQTGKGGQMLRLNRIFGRKDEGSAAPSAPPEAVEDWDEAEADAYLAQQEGLLPVDTAPAEPVPVIPPETPAVNSADTQRQWATAQLAVQNAQQPAMMADLSEVALPDTGRGGRRVGRVKTRLLGFDHGQGLTVDPIEAAKAAVPAGQCRFPMGWIVVTHGPGRGAFFPVFNGVSQIGRGEDQAIRLDFGDSSISRSNHAAIAYDDESNGFYLGHGGKTNIVRLNDRPVISTEPMQHHDQIRIGETTLMFVALCAEGFRWDKDEAGDFG
jgi:hypothetical protein